MLDAIKSAPDRFEIVIRKKNYYFSKILSCRLGETLCFIAFLEPKAMANFDQILLVSLGPCPYRRFSFQPFSLPCFICLRLVAAIIYCASDSH